MFDSNERAGSDRRVIAIIARHEVIEMWHMYRMRTDYRERDIQLPKEVKTRVISGRRERREIYRRQVARQEWSHYMIQRYQATRMLPWTPALGLSMLIPGTLFAASSANQGITEVPLTMLVIQSALITVGGLLAVASGWRILSQRVRSTDGIPLESLGVSSHALGFTSGAVASEPSPSGYRAGRLMGVMEADVAVGEWQVVEEHVSELGWHPA